MNTDERRARGNQTPEAMINELNPDQRRMLQDLEPWGWRLAFIRHPPGGPIVPVAMIPQTDEFIVLQETGHYSQPADFVLRKARTGQPVQAGDVPQFAMAS